MTKLEAMVKLWPGFEFREIPTCFRVDPFAMYDKWQNCVTSGNAQEGHRLACVLLSYIIKLEKDSGRRAD